MRAISSGGSVLEEMVIASFRLSQSISWVNFNPISPFWDFPGATLESARASWPGEKLTIEGRFPTNFSLGTRALKPTLAFRCCLDNPGIPSPSPHRAPAWTP